MHHFTISERYTDISLYIKNITSDLQILHDWVSKYPWNLLIGYLNISGLRMKIIDLRGIVPYHQLDYFALSETKISESFPSELGEVEKGGGKK